MGIKKRKMKIFVASTIAAIGVNGQETISCDINGSSTSLFEIHCDAEEAEMIVTINEACRLQEFSHIDFENSFIQGNITANTVADINTDCSDSGEYEAKDLDGAWTWEIDLNGDCVSYGSYNLYWKAADENMYQLGTVPLSCNLGQIEVDSDSLELTERNIAGLSESFTGAISDLVELEVKVSPSTENPKVNADINVATAIQDYAVATSAEIGNHVQLLLKESDSSYTVMDDYSLSLNQCWASKADEEADHVYDSSLGHILLWDEFCPQFPWVGPLAYATASLPTHGTGQDVSGYLGEFWDTSDQVQQIHFRQFGWTNTANTDVYYHCIIKVCELSEQENCASLHLRDTDPTVCESDNSFAPPTSTRKRRSLANNEQASVSAGISVQPISASECQNISGDHSVCYGI